MLIRQIGYIFLYIAGIFSPVMIVLLSHDEGHQHQRLEHPLIHEVAISFALMALMIFTFQVILAGRFKWVCNAFGLDSLIRFHRYTAVFATGLIIFHPVLLSIASNDWQLLIGLDISWHIWLGRAALILLIINIFISVFQSKLKIKFETWRIFHNILGLSILTFAYIHSWFVGSDIQNNSLLQGVWMVLFLGTIFLFVFHRYLRPLLLRQHLYQVVEVLQESKTVWTIKLSPPSGRKKFNYSPGQFHFITFHRGRNLPEEEHHWTISSSPTEEKYISSTIKESGDFTATIGQTQLGDTATLHGAFGRFSYVLYPKEKDFVFIAGGIGITPFISMLRHMRDTHKTFPVLLLYANKEEGDILFRKELEEIRENGYPKLKIVHILSNPSVSWKGGTGHLDQEKIHALCSENIKEKSFYICGPQGLKKSIIQNLHKLKVKSGKIHTEIFSFLD